MKTVTVDQLEVGKTYEILSTIYKEGWFKAKLIEQESVKVPVFKAEDNGEIILSDFVDVVRM